MNEAQETYLKHYSGVDKIDQMLLGWDLSYRSWRWCYAPTRHAKAIAMSMAYSLYLQCAEGTVDPKWKVTPVLGPRFWQRMSLQMVQYKCSNLDYPGDEKMHKNTQMNKKKLGTRKFANLVLSNVTIISRESPIRNTLMKKTMRSKKDKAMRWKYDAIEATFE
jgi:hypothetical protein